jgi:cytochrome P450
MKSYEELENEYDKKLEELRENRRQCDRINAEMNDLNRQYERLHFLGVPDTRKPKSNEVKC